MKWIQYFIIIIFEFSLLFPIQFSTSIGNCNLNVYNNKDYNSQEIVDLIKKETSRLVEIYGPVKTSDFDIFVPVSKKEFYSLAHSAPEWGIAIASKKHNRIVIQAPYLAKITFNRFKTIIIHEINHLYIYKKNNIFLPSWFIEGLAMKASNEFSLLHKIEISQAYWKNNLIPLPGLYNFSTKSKSKIKLAYAQAAAAINYIEFYYGKETLINIIKQINNNNEFWEIIYNVTKHDKINFQINYENYIKDNFKWIFLLKIKNIVFIFLPFILFFGLWLKNNHNKKIITKWEKEDEIEIT